MDGSFGTFAGDFNKLICYATSKKCGFDPQDFATSLEECHCEMLVTESQNHTSLVLERFSGHHLVQSLMPKQVHLEQEAQDYVDPSGCLPLYSTHSLVD